MNAFCSWSGGKDSAMALHRALKRDKLTVTHCLNMVTEDRKYSRSHGIKTQILALQAKAINLPILQQPATWDNYEDQFKAAVSQLKKEGITAGIFGDIDLEPHREWVERVCAQMGINAFLPLWQEKREHLMDEFFNLGFKAVITATESSFMNETWLGRSIDSTFVRDLQQLGNVDICGEKGEYHTLVTDGPYFSKRLIIKETKPAKINKHWFLNITDCRLEDK